MTILLIPLAIISFALNAAVTRLVQVRFPGQKGVLRAYQALFCLTAAIVFGGAQAVTGASAVAETPLLPAALYGMAFGAFFFGAVAYIARCYEIGSMSLTSIIVNLSLFIPLVYSCIAFGDAITPVRAVGVALIAVTVILAVDQGKGGTSLKWWLAVLLAFLSNGITAVLQKSYVTGHGEGLTMLFMSIAYLTAAILFAVNALVEKRSSGAALAVGKVLPLAVLSGLGSFGGNALLGVLCTRVSGTVLYPCVNGGLCIVSAVVSFLWFHEKPTSRKLLSIAVGVAAIVLLNL